MPRIFTTIASGASVSGDVDLSQYNTLIGIDLPTVTSGDLYLRGSFDTNSANFHRVNDDIGDIKFSTGPGSKMALWPQAFMLPPYARLETSVAQSDTRTLTLLAR